MPPYHESTTADHSSNASCASIPYYSPTTPCARRLLEPPAVVIKTHIYHRRDDTPDPETARYRKNKRYRKQPHAAAARVYTPSFGALPMASFVIWYRGSPPTPAFCRKYSAEKA